MNDTHDVIERLLRLAGPRKAVSSDRLLRVKSAVRAEWRAQVRTRRRNTSLAWSVGGLAAAALLIIGLRVAMREDATVVNPELNVGTLDGTGESLQSGRVVATAAGDFALIRLSSGAEVRIDRNTRVRVMSAAAITLEQGGMYVSSDVTSPSASLEVHTKFGVARDIGTRFEVRIGDSSLRVRVREGVVQLQQTRQSYEAKAGEELSLDASGSLVRRSVPVYGSDWDWTLAAAPPFEIDGRTLREFLDWITTENGWQLRFADTDTEQKSSGNILRGSIDGMTPLESLAAVLPVSGVEYHLENGVLLVGRGLGGSRD